MSHEVIVLGCNGMLGHILYLYLQQQQEFEVTGVARTDKWFSNVQYDFHDSRFWTWLEKQNPLAVVNCAGILVGQSDKHPAEALYINSYLPHRLAEVFADKPTVVVQISTDCVFSGKHGPYAVNSLHDGEGYYARTKSLGEIKNPKDLTIRTSIVGPELKEEGTGLFHWWAQQSGEIKGFTKAKWSGLTTLELSKCIYGFLSYCLIHSELGYPAPAGLCQIAGIPISKFDLLSDWNRIFDKELTILPDMSYECNKVLLPTYSAPLPMPNPVHVKMASHIKTWMAEHSSLYPHYSHLRI